MKQLIGFFMYQNGYTNFYPAYYPQKHDGDLQLEDIQVFYDFPDYGILPLEKEYIIQEDFFKKPILLRYDERLIKTNSNTKSKDLYKNILDYAEDEMFSVEQLHETDNLFGYHFYPVIDITNLYAIKAKDGSTNFAIKSETLPNIMKDTPVVLVDSKSSVGVLCRFTMRRNLKKHKLVHDIPVLFCEQQHCTPNSHISVFRLDSSIQSYSLPYTCDESTEDCYINTTENYLYQNYYGWTVAPKLGDEKYYIDNTEGVCRLISTGAQPASFADSFTSSSTSDNLFFLTGDQILAQVENYLASSGRPTCRDDIVNYCVCLTQGFITTFSGAPGTGKTTLCRLLAEALGLTRENTSRYVEVPVGRGWTDIKDFVGYVAPFDMGHNDEFDGVTPTNADVCKSFYAMHNNWEDENGKGLCLIALDEANLSPIEYYWSQFLRLCQLDDKAARRTIQVAKNPWRISPNLRFVATVNFDHTTEGLSPRFLDRSWVIPLSAPKGIYHYSSRITPALPEHTVTIHEMKAAFEAFESPLSPEIATLWENIRQAFSKDSIDLPLSPRNILAVESYCIAASKYIKPIDALDYAILQKILPTISGYGSRYDELISNISEIAESNGLHRVGSYLKKMERAAGENSNFYQFFTR